MSKSLPLYQGNGGTNDYEIMRKKWTKGETLAYVYSEKAKKRSVNVDEKKDRISSQESKTAEPECTISKHNALKQKKTSAIITSISLLIGFSLLCSQQRVVMCNSDIEKRYIRD